MLAHVAARFGIVAALVCIAQTAGAQADQPYYADGEIHCPNGTSAIFHSAGEPPNDVALRMACGFKGTDEQTADGQTTKVQPAANNVADEVAEAIKAAPRSPNGLPMEAVWERAPGAPDAEFTDARPYFVSRWGGIVIRGRRNGDLIDRALAARHCGASDNPATDIYFIGEAPPNICEGVTAVAAGETKSFTSPVTIKGSIGRYVKMGTSSGWVVREFLQNINGVVSSGLGPATGEAASEWGVSSLGAFYRNEDGKHVFYAPGETVQMTKNFSFVVEPVMDEDELAAQAAGAIMNAIATDPAIANIGRPKAKAPWQWSFLLVIGIPLGLIGGAIYGFVHFARRRRGAHPVSGGQPPSQALTVDAMSHAAGVAAVGDVVPAAPGSDEAASGVEEFFGMSRTSANMRRKGWLVLFTLAGPGLFFFSMLWWGEPTVVSNVLELLYHFVLSKLLPLGLIALGIAGAVSFFRLGNKPETEVLWYRLDRAGLHILHDHLRLVAQSEIVQTAGEAGALIAWDAMKSVVVVPGAIPKVKIVRRAPGAIIDRTMTLSAGQRSRGGAIFADRLPLWFAAMRTGATAPIRMASTMTGALPPQPDVQQPAVEE